MKSFATIFFLAMLSCLAAQKPAPPTQATETTIKPADPFQASISISKASLTQLSEWIDAWEKQLKAEESARTSNLNLSKSNINRQAGAPVVTSRSNIKQLAQKLDDLENSNSSNRSAKLTEVHKALAELEAPITELHNSIVSMGRTHAAKAAELKTKHDTVKNSIGNIR